MWVSGDQEAVRPMRGSNCCCSHCYDLAALSLTLPVRVPFMTCRRSARSATESTGEEEEAAPAAGSEAGAGQVGRRRAVTQPGRASQQRLHRPEA